MVLGRTAYRKCLWSCDEKQIYQPSRAISTVCACVWKLPRRICKTVLFPIQIPTMRLGQRTRDELCGVHRLSDLFLSWLFATETFDWSSGRLCLRRFRRESLNLPFSRSTMSRQSALECLANELIHEIFDYLSTVDIIYSFHPLNQRFSRLISQRSFQIDLTHLSKQQFEHAQRTLPLNQISALKISQQWTINMLSRLSFRSMTHLRVLIFSHVGYGELRSLFQSRDFSTILGQLNTLKIQSSFVNGLDRERLLVLRKIFSQMPKLRICQVPLIDVNDLEDLKPTFTLEQVRIDYCTMLCLGK